MVMLKNPLPPTGSENFPGWHTSADELEFALAMYAYQKKHRRRYPAWSEVLYVLRSLGYVKGEAPLDPGPAPPDPFGFELSGRPTLAEIEACS